MKGTSVKPKVPKVLKKDQTQAHLVAIATALITQVVAYVPKWAPEKQLLISAAGIVIGAAFLIAHAIQSGKASPADLAKDAAQFVQAEVGKVDFAALAKDALSGNMSGVVQDELKKVLTSGLGAVAAAPAPAPTAAPVAPAAPSPQVTS